ncbi:PREDICTED: tripartite motif-containing protein 60 [Chinchilla lanigera]|uniref:Tripartite motif containing 61 n=1 Tax=Chinchilla lanigera TaxID=34839 RepID=A0A8C2WBI7_CHILA|nr:PREDICTED: tripartite motif-containing protein 60 [Chinchilla lanigera]XP_013370700.1 PREDICTED: tripartite motif-containing protein 60 [Chinchilla lanigera]XP_013370702.1 PREDICTED: tripartite motif-containing protein 60 [Chinchilla lanigera]
MDLAAALADLQAEASCPICLGYLKNPVTIYCGHNFCLACISESWKDLQGRFPCPSCHHLCPEKKFQNNFQLGSLTEMAKLLPLRRSKRKRQEDSIVCEKHKQVLTVFCQKDMEVLCPQCSFSADHQQHYIWPIEKAAVYHRERLEREIELWQERVEQVEKVITMQTGKSVELKKRVEHRREEIKSEFEQFMLFLQNEQEAVLRQLQDEEREILGKLNANLADASDHASASRGLLREIESKYVKSEVELLASVKSIYHRYKNLKCPEMFSFQFKEYSYRLPPQYSGLSRIVKQFHVDVVLDPETAHRKLIISEDRKSVRYGNTQKLPHSPEKFYLWPAVLGASAYSSGRQYWEVEVRNKPEWILGVCSEALPRRKKNHSQPFLVKDGLWGIGRCSSTRYVVVGPKKISLLPKVLPTKIGVFLDSEMGEVSFYNLSDRSLLYTFSDYFRGALWPYFYTGTESRPLRICTVTEAEG